MCSNSLKSNYAWWRKTQPKPEGRETYKSLHSIFKMKTRIDLASSSCPRSAELQWEGRTRAGTLANATYEPKMRSACATYRHSLALPGVNDDMAKNVTITSVQQQYPPQTYVADQRGKSASTAEPIQKQIRMENRTYELCIACSQLIVSPAPSTGSCRSLGTVSNTDLIANMYLCS